MAAGRRRWWALAALALSGLVVGLDLTVLNLALPTVAVALRITSGGVLQWFVVSYSLVFAAMLLPAGLLGDRFGRKRLLLVALVVFGAASLACAYSSSAGELIAARALLGLGAAFIVPLSVAVIPVLFAEEERQRAITVVLGATMISFPLGPILGGWLLTRFWWGSVFLINVPVIVLALVAVAALIPESRSAQRAPFDAAGVVLSSAGLTVLSYGLIEAGQHGWGDPVDIAAMTAGVLVLAGFVAWERAVSRRGRRPLVDLSLFGSRGFTWGTILATLVTFATFGLLFAVPTYYQAIVGVDPLGAGVRLLPMAGGLVIGAVVSDRLARPIGTKLTVAWGFVLLAAGLLMGALTSVGSGYGYAALWVTVVGAGLGFALPGAMDAALGALSAERSGVGSGLIMALRQVGGTFGVAILGSVLSSGYRSGLDGGVAMPSVLASAVRDNVSEGVAVAHHIGSATLLAAVRAAFVRGMDVMMAVCCVIAVAGVVATVLFLPRRAAASEPLDLADAARSQPPTRAAAVAATGGQGTESTQPAAGGR